MNVLPNDQKSVIERSGSKEIMDLPRKYVSDSLSHREGRISLLAHARKV